METILILKTAKLSAHTLKCPTCLVPYVFSSLTCLVPYLLPCLMCSRVSRALVPYMTIAPRALRSYLSHAYFALMFPCLIIVFLLVSFFEKFTTVKTKMVCR